jgi:hypothetical protein
VRKSVVYPVNAFSVQETWHNDMLERALRYQCGPEATEIKVGHGSLPSRSQVDCAIAISLSPSSNCAQPQHAFLVSV